MALSQVYEGTLDEIIARHGKELGGRRLKVVVNESIAPTNEAERPFYETATPEQWAHALRAWSDSHDSVAYPLSDAAIDRESIYEGRGE